MAGYVCISYEFHLIYTYIYVYIYIYTYTCTHIHAHAYIYTHVYMYTVYVYKCMCGCSFGWLQVHSAAAWRRIRISTGRSPRKKTLVVKLPDVSLAPIRFGALQENRPEELQFALESDGYLCRVGRSRTVMSEIYRGRMPL